MKNLTAQLACASASDCRFKLQQSAVTNKYILHFTLIHSFSGPVLEEFTTGVVFCPIFQGKALRISYNSDLLWLDSLLSNKC